MSVAADPTEVEYVEVQGKGRWRFKPRGLSITWSHNERYWRMPDKGTEDPAEVLVPGLSWLEISGLSPQPLLKGKTYALSFRISLGENMYGWNECPPVFILAKVGRKGRAEWTKVDLIDLRLTGDNIAEIPEGKLQFDVPRNVADTKLRFGLYETWSQKSKQGFKIHEAIVEEMHGDF